MTILHLAARHHANVFAIGFSYGQKHDVELLAAADEAKSIGVPYNVLNMRSVGMVGNSALTTHTHTDTARPHDDMAGVPASFVPARNAMFLTLAHAYALHPAIQADYVYGGMCQTDYSGYPDCRAVFIEALQTALNIGYNAEVVFETPLMYLTKAETFQLAGELGVLDRIINNSRTCYNGSDYVNAWGYGCGECPACDLRRKGYNEFVTERNLKV